MIVEMAGRPAEHVKSSLEAHIGILNDVKDIGVHSIKVSEPKEIERPEGAAEAEPMFTSFAEADFECENFGRLSETMFDFMPSSVEIIEPSKISIDCVEATALLNNLSGRLHRYDEIAKILGERHTQMEAQLKLAQEVLIKKDAEIVELKKGPKKKSKKKVVKKSKKK